MLGFGISGSFCVVGFWFLGTWKRRKSSTSTSSVNCFEYEGSDSESSVFLFSLFFIFVHISSSSMPHLYLSQLQIPTVSFPIFFISFFFGWSVLFVPKVYLFSHSKFWKFQFCPEYQFHLLNLLGILQMLQHKSYKLMCYLNTLFANGR